MHGVVQVILADERICASRVLRSVVNGQEDLGEAESARRTWVTESKTLMGGMHPKFGQHGEERTGSNECDDPEVMIRMNERAKE